MTKKCSQVLYHFLMTLKTLNFLNKIGEACFNVLSWFAGCWGKLKVLCTVKVCIVIVNDKVSTHHRLFVSGHQSRDFTEEKSFYCLNFLTS